LLGFAVAIAVGRLVVGLRFPVGGGGLGMAQPKAWWYMHRLCHSVFVQYRQSVCEGCSSGAGVEPTCVRNIL